MATKPKETTQRDYTQTVLDSFVLWPQPERRGFIKALVAADRAAERLHKMYPQVDEEAAAKDEQPSLIEVEVQG
jgi:hypothetical protein